MCVIGELIMAKDRYSQRRKTKQKADLMTHYLITTREKLMVVSVKDI